MHAELERRPLRPLAKGKAPKQEADASKAKWAHTDFILSILRTQPSSTPKAIREELAKSGRVVANLDGVIYLLRKSGRIKRTGTRGKYRYSVAK